MALVVAAELVGGAARADSGRVSAPEIRRPLPDGASAKIILVSTAGASSAVGALVTELLGRQGIQCEHSEVARFDPQALFDEPTSEPRVLVGIVLEPTRASLYFRGPTGQRFLLRKLALPNGLDEVGQELIAQVVESSTLALFYSTDGLSRAQVNDALAREPKEAQTRAAAASPAAVRAPSPSARPSAPLAQPARPNQTAPSPFEVMFGVRYVAAWAGPKLGLLHGPGLELGIAHRSRVLIRARLTGERWFERSFSGDEVSARLGGFALRGGAELGLPLAASQTLLAGLAAGADVLRLEPRSSPSNQISLAAPSTDVAPVLRLELRYERVFSRIVLAAGPFLDASLVDTHYDVLEGGVRHRVAAPWLARPGFALASAFSF